ncbi:PQQ-binding-like beta-propeller repeat protein [Solwaraspora sp. WMMA2056]|uniref:outer membrane protein assembly factor BamB family protein n=1 Tax=Solwaraspora sp. WMMA2056 TaxID=3015161 RepID=UPI00259B8E41|nr:PQQ-binding-like beta-propeller repeat protein [Solwaraspora sp. WMMA2056]WJK42831.1 PQQ-binding-like beta-propeller repeat protein [Solwaraspora sp. WMMA2056]
MVIELGLTREPQAPPPTTAGGWWRRRPSGPAAGGWSPVRRARPYAVLAGLAMLLGLTGAAPPDGPLLVPVAAHQVKARDIVLAGDRLLVTSAAVQGSTTTWQLSAYAIPAGDLLWTVPLHAASWRLRQVRRTGDVMLVDPRSAPGAGATMILDAATGQTRWVAPDGLVLTDDGRTALLPEPGESTGVPSTLVAVDVGSGDELWSTGLAASTEVLAGAAGQVLLVGADGRAEVREGRTGAVRRTAELGAVSRPDSMGGTLVMRQSNGGQLGMVGYDPTTLRQLWQRPVPYGPGRITECGELICFPAGAQIEAVDPLTGELVWRIDADLVVDFDSYLVAYSVAGVPAADGGSGASGGSGGTSDSTSSGAGAGSGRIVDPATGRTLLPMSAWYTELEGRGDATFVGYRQPVEDGPAWLAVLTPTTQVLRLVGVVPGPVGGCVADEATIVCRSGADGITIWRYQL